MYCCLMVCRTASTAVSVRRTREAGTSATDPALRPIERVRGDAELRLELLAELRLVNVVLVVALEREAVDRVREVVAVAVRAEVRDELIEVVCAGTERATRRKVDVADDLVHAYAAGNVAAFVCLLLQLL